ncbi:MAG TPA: hypothetical protein PKN23_09375 [Candidatus Hydrogenedentes bacterium]|nr:hypothetical protein [Candidatus Hydrogenedentota bacterium]HOH49890.1 hypothetical protein [Candidatus Hydrogenedentota bacterium]
MTPPPPSGRRARRTLIAAALLLAAGMVLFVRLDAALKAGGVPRLAPPDAAWVVSSPDLPGFWVDFMYRPPGEYFQKHYPQGEAMLALRARLLTGIRPTAGRWDFWLGSPAVLSGGIGHWCLVTRPGVAARVAILAGGMVGDAGRFRGMHYQWRDGLLVLSDSAEWATELRETPAPPPDIETKLRTSSVFLTFPKGWARATVVNGDSGSDLILDGTANLSDRSDTSDPSDQPKTAATVPLLEWPEAPAVTFCAADAAACGEALALLRRGLDALLADSPLRGVLAAAGTRWGASLAGLPDQEAPAEGAGSPFAAAALYGLRWDGAAPLPEAAGAWRGILPDYGALQRSLPDPARRVMEWNGTGGVMLPLLGGALSLCLMPAEGGETFAASNEPVMARLAAAPPAWRGAGPGVCRVRAHGPALAALLRETLTHAAAEGWLPGTTPRELERTVLPLLRVVDEVECVELVADRTADGLSWRAEEVAASPAGPPGNTP